MAYILLVGMFLFISGIMVFFITGMVFGLFTKNNGGRNVKIVAVLFAIVMVLLIINITGMI